MANGSASSRRAHSGPTRPELARRRGPRPDTSFGITRTVTLAKIVSGGQTGVDRGALDAALHAGFTCGGWCPPQRLAEDGRIPDRYLLREMPRGGYRGRTARNVADSDGSVVIYFGQPQGGTKETLLECVKLEKPYEPIDASKIPPDRAASLVATFIAEQHIATLNVAGPRASEVSDAYGYAFDFVTNLLTAQRTNPKVAFADPS